MKKLQAVKKAGALLLCAGFAVGGTACNFFTTDNEQDMSQVVAEVDITKSFDSVEEGKFASYKNIVSKSNGKIYKRDLVAYFLNYGSQYVDSYGYEKTFNMFMDALVTRKIVVQYAMAYYLAYGGTNFENTYDAYMESQKDELKGVNEETRQEVLTLKYFLTDNGTATAENDGYARSVYALKKSINDALDSTEEKYVEADEHDHDEVEGAETERTMPTGVKTAKEDYYETDYEIYTGYNTADSCGQYEKKENSTTRSRRKAYNGFISNLAGNNLLGEVKDTTDFLKIDYYYVELAGQLEQALINKYSDTITEIADSDLTDEIVQASYTELLNKQTTAYDQDASAFETALDSLSDQSFVLYAPDTGDANKKYGYVYNILLPFSTTDTQLLSAYDKGTDEYYKARRNVIKNVKGGDLRGAWFSNCEDDNYASFDENSGKYYFFKDMFGTDKYDDLKQYASVIPYQGMVVKEGDAYKAVKPTKLDIDAFIALMEGTLTENGFSVSGAKTTCYNETGDYVKTEGDYNWADFMYYSGKVSAAGGDFAGALDNYFVKDTDEYKAVSIVNELTFAYSTDPGCLNTYMGYLVTPTCETKYVKEFAYAAKEAVKLGAGGYTVCATDYGWHIMYCSYAFDAGEVYAGFDTAQKGTEGTFSYNYYETLKSTTADKYSQIMQTQILKDFNNGTNVVKFTERYQDLLDLDKK